MSSETTTQTADAQPDVTMDDVLSRLPDDVRETSDWFYDDESFERLTASEMEMQVNLEQGMFGQDGYTVTLGAVCAGFGTDKYEILYEHTYTRLGDAINRYTQIVRGDFRVSINASIKFD